MNDRICLIIPYYEDKQGLLKSLNSVYLQESDLILVVDDGSQDSPAIDFCPDQINMTNIRLVTLPSNRGISEALNAAIEAVPPAYSLIGRLDCGDTCRPDRFTKQRKFLNEHPDVVAVGSWVRFTEPSGKYLYTLKQPSSTKALMHAMHINSSLTHPAVLMRKTAVEQAGRYPTIYPAAEDFALFWNLSAIGDLANIPEPLVDCTTNDGGISIQSRNSQLRSRIKILWKHFDYTPIAIYGLCRSLGQLHLPRNATTVLRRLKERLAS